ncbi:hypothetical protein ACFV0L_37155 [Streptosporangium canum]|uniref:hypothetical protein n=1 Tax=Streptosporangium canum TaxID=324952 RepID=UPI0036AE5721
MTAALRFGAVLAAAGPVILAAFEVGRESVGWFCFGADFGPSALESTSWELRFWAELLLPAVLAGLLLRGPRRATLTAVSAVGSVLALGLVTAVFLPGTDPCTGQALPVVLPWYLIVCYMGAAASLVLAARSPLPPVRHGVVLWAVAAAAAAWTVVICRLPVAADDFPAPGLVYEASESFWDAPEMWAFTAEVIGLPIVIVALAAAAKGAAPGRWGRLTGAGVGVFLLLFALIDLVAHVSRYGSDFSVHPATLVRWPLLLAAVLTLLATRRRQEPASRTGIIRSLRHKTPGQPKDLAVLIVVVVAAAWLVVSSFAPNSP